MAEGVGYGTRGDFAVLIGTRPEAIKLMPVVHALEEAGARPWVFLTGQHNEMLQPWLGEFGLEADEKLEVMELDQSLAGLSARLLTGLQELLRRHRPRILIVQGDTTSVAVAALVGFYDNVRIAHVEAGLRTFSRRSPFPEEMNRRLVACLADFHFAPTPRARENLMAEGVQPSAIHLVGNTVIDALFYARNRLVHRLRPEEPLAAILASERRIVLVTAHRRESFGEDLRSIAEGIRRLAQTFPEVAIVYPVHLNPNVEGLMRKSLAGLPNVYLLEPLSYPRFVQVLLRAGLVLTDSGGVQEEATALGIPLLVARRTSERLEAVEAGVAELVGPDAERIVEAATRLLTDEMAYARRAVPSPVFGDGRAARRIAEILIGRL